MLLYARQCKSMLLFTPLALLKILHYATQTYQHPFFSLKY